jgi:hypothetical protein
MERQRRHEDRGERRGRRDGRAQAERDEQPEDGEHGGHVAGERDVEERAVAGDRLQQRGGERDRDAALVEAGVVGDPCRVARVLRVDRAQPRAERAVERASQRLALRHPVVDLVDAGLVEQAVRRPARRPAERTVHGQQGEGHQGG